MKKTKTKTAATHGPTGIAKSYAAAARACKLTPRTIRDLKAEGFPGIKVDGTVDLDAFWPAYLRRKAEKTGPADARYRKLTAEAERVELYVAEKKRTLISRAWMAERIHAAAGKVNGFRIKSEAEHPLCFAAAGNDVPKCREVIGTIWDEILAAMNGLSRDFDEAVPLLRDRIVPALDKWRSDRGCAGLVAEIEAAIADHDGSKLFEAPKN